MEVAAETTTATRPVHLPKTPRKHNRKGSLRNAANKDSTENIRARARAARKNGSAGALSPTDATSGDASARSGMGREFTVGNVGNNGMIYLRPVIRPAVQRQRPAPPPFTFPQEAQSAAVTPDTHHGQTKNDFNGSLFTNSRPPTAISPSKRAHKVSKDDSQLPALPPLEALTHMRSRSFSNDNEPVQKDGLNNGTFKVVIHRPSLRRPRTAESGSLPMLEVPIPHYRLGTPRFNSQGVPILRSSAYTRTSATEDYRSSSISRSPNERRFSFMSSNRAGHSLAAGISNNALSVISRQQWTQQHSPDGPESQMQMASLPAALAPIDMQIYDILTKNPDDPMVVRYAPGTKDIVAASPARLIAYITSSEFLDYELLSDFFLTFRSYLGPTELAAFLIARLRWSVVGSHDSGRIVRVRTFVALRHWILNYFIDDFIPDYHLRVAICAMVNELHRDLRTRSDRGGHDAKIITELKKCWRRTCGLFWDHPDHTHPNRPEDDISPGGYIGLRDSQGDQLAIMDEPFLAFQGHNRAGSSKDIAHPIAPAVAKSHGQQKPAAISTHTKDDTTFIATSPTSEGSVQVMSCSIPMRGIHRMEGGSAVRLYPHPAVAGHRRNVSASTPSRPRGDHKRSGSFSDALRDTRPPHSPGKASSIETDHEHQAVLPIPGSLVRGVLVQPDSPFFEFAPTEALKNAPLQTEVHPASAPTSPQDKSPSLGNPGVKRLLGSVRRVLSTKPEYGSMGKSSIRNDYDGLGVSPKPVAGGQRSVVKTVRPQVRVDLLASKVYQSFNVALGVDLMGDGMKRHYGEAYDDSLQLPGHDLAKEPNLPYAKMDTSRMNSNFTAGSRSIVIVDDTGSAELYLMSGALPVPNKDGLGIPQTLPMSAPPTTRHFDYISAHSRARNFSLDEILASSNAGMFQPLNQELYPTHTAFQDHRPPSAVSDKQTLTDRGASIASSRTADTVMLRRYASFHSGMSVNTPGATSSMAPSSQDDPFFLERPPARQLRRRPAADLRAANHAQDSGLLRRPRSAEAYPGHTSMSSPTNTDSVMTDRRPMLPQSVYIASRDTRQETGSKLHKSISLVDTHSSQPNLRPSFQAEVAKLAALPDDEDDGGIESTLLKLEGRYEKRPSPRSSGGASSSGMYDETSGQLDIAKLHDALIATPKVQAQDLIQVTSPITSEISPKQITTESVQSEDSYSSVPLLERGLSSAPMPLSIPIRVKPTTEDRTVPVLISPKSSTVTNNPTALSSEPPQKADSMLQVPRNGTIPVGIVAHHSFLLNDDQHLSDESEDSGEFVDAEEDQSQGVRSFYDEDMDDEYPAHPLRHPSTPALPLEHDDHSYEPAPPKAPFEDAKVGQATSLLASDGAPLFGSTVANVQPARPRQLTESGSPRRASHLPFILAHDPEFLAQQFTIVEKDALDEIDWKELIDLRWKHSIPAVHDWVEYLKSHEPHGVEIVIARFNLMTKWALSEIVLCENMGERVQCIIQYIRIAAHARRLRNYATMYQITLALVSSDCTRLKRTWMQIPAAERAMMRELEALVQPVRNFYNLRLEMETAQADCGCIPFIGIYTRDLVYNAQKPAYITSPPNSEHPLVNFERHHTSATIVKSLLRLLESSSAYDFQPDYGVLSKCLWMAALGDDEIASLSRRLE